MESTKIQMEKMEFGKKLNGFLRALRNLVGKVTRDVAEVVVLCTELEQDKH